MAGVFSCEGMLKWEDWILRSGWLRMLLVLRPQHVHQVLLNLHYKR
jgi:hypothetical protein